MVTMNVQTMEGGGLHDQEGRVGFLRHQMLGRGIHVVAVQEARTPKTASVLSEAYVRLCSGRSDSGQLGTELWFLRDTGTSDVAFRPEDLTVVAFNPRLIVVKVASPLWRGVIASIHAPTRGDQQREAWWVDLAATLSRIVGNWPLLLAGDWNTRFDCSRHLRVGGLLCDSKDQVPEGCLHILSRHDLWLPSTFLHVHTGPSDTWFSPGFAKPSRLDYIAVPTNWVVGEGASRTLPDVDLGHTSLDHVAVQLDVWCPPRAAAVRPGGRPVHFDRLAMSTSEGQARLRDICSRTPDVEWCVDASTHFHTVQQYLQAELGRAFPARKRKVAQSFLTDSTWVLKDYRVWLRKRAMRCKILSKCLEAAAAFTAWRRDGNLRAEFAIAVAQLCGETHRAAQYVRSLRDTKLEFRRALRNDRQQFLASLAQQALDMPTKDVLARLRPLLCPGGKRSRGYAGLPAVRMEDGTLAGDAEQARDRWIRHFAQNEGGTRVSEAALVSEYRQRQQGKSLDFTILPGELPTRIQLEASMLACVTGKAAGPDHLPPELLHYGGGSLSKSLYALFLKMAMRLDEALLWKGGTLHSAWKGKLSPDQCHSHRALLVSSVVGKALHSTIRGCCTQPMKMAATPLQVGGLPAYPVTFASHCVRLFQSHCKGRSHFLLFLDLKEAFYRVFRALLRSDAPSEEEIAYFFRQLELPPSVFDRFRRTVCQENSLAAAGSSQWLRAVLGEILSDSWFKMQWQEDVTRTSLGVRPGDALADTLFFFVFSQVLRATRQRLTAAGLTYDLPWSRDMHGCVVDWNGAAGECVCLSDAVWMDDACLMGSVDRAADAVKSLADTAGILIDECLRRGLQPSLEANKTEAILTLHGEGARRVRQDCLSVHLPTIALQSEHWAGGRLRIVPAYKHLGGRLHHKGLLMEEVKIRLGQAWSAFQSRKRQIFSQRQVALGDKMVLFKSLVCSVLFFGSGTWPRILERERRALQTGYVNLCRSILRCHYRGDATRLTEDRVLALTGAPSLNTALHVERLVYFRSFLQLNAPEAWALAHAERHWLGQVRESLLWLWTHSGASLLHPSWDEAWVAWRDVLDHRPRMWKRLVRKAQDSATRKEVLLEGWQQCRGTLVRGFLQQGAIVQGLQDGAAEGFGDGAFFCGPCLSSPSSSGQYTLSASMGV